MKIAILRVPSAATPRPGCGPRRRRAGIRSRCSTPCASRSTSPARSRTCSSALHYDAILPRIGNSVTYSAPPSRQFEQMDVYTPNTANGIANFREISCAPVRFSRATTSVCRRPPSCATAPTSSRRLSVSAALRSSSNPSGGHARHRGHPRALDQGGRSDHRDPAKQSRQNVLIQRFVIESKARYPGARRRGPAGRRHGRTLEVMSFAPMSTGVVRPRRLRLILPMRRRRCARRRSWGCESPGWTCSKARTAHW